MVLLRIAFPDSTDSMRWKRVWPLPDAKSFSIISAFAIYHSFVFAYARRSFISLVCVHCQSRFTGKIFPDSFKAANLDDIHCLVVQSGEVGRSDFALEIIVFLTKCPTSSKWMAPRYGYWLKWILQWVLMRNLKLLVLLPEKAVSR